MATRPRAGTAAAAIASLAALAYAARAAAFLDVGGDALLADLLANAAKQLSTAAESLSELRGARAELERIRLYADDAAEADRTVERVSAPWMDGQPRSDLDAARPDLGRLRTGAQGALDLSSSAWSQGTDPLRRPSTACVAGPSGTRTCVELAGDLETARVLSALRATFGLGLESVEARVVDAEAAATIQADAARSRVAVLEGLRTRTLLERCRPASDLQGAREARQVAEACGLAAAQAEILGLEEAEAANATLSQIARLEAVAAEQRNAELRRRVAAEEAHRAALTAGLPALVEQRVTIRPGGASL